MMITTTRRMRRTTTTMAWRRIMTRRMTTKTIYLCTIKYDTSLENSAQSSEESQNLAQSHPISRRFAQSHAGSCNLMPIYVISQTCEWIRAISLRFTQSLSDFHRLVWIKMTTFYMNSNIRRIMSHTFLFRGGVRILWVQDFACTIDVLSKNYHFC